MFIVVVLAGTVPVAAQELVKQINVGDGATVEIVNRFGRIEVVAAGKDEPSMLKAASARGVVEREVASSAANGRTRFEITPLDPKKRIDIVLRVPERVSLKLETVAGEIRISGNFAVVQAATETGTIATDVPLDDVSYSFLWTASRPRVLSDKKLSEVKEKSAGRFVIAGTIVKKADDADKEKPDPVSLSFTTARGIVLLNVNPSEVPSDLRERPLTNAAKAVIRSGDGLLMEAIRRASPKYFGEYAATLPPLKLEPRFTPASQRPAGVNSDVKRVLARITDLNNRAVPDLKKNDFQVIEAGEEREIVSVEQTTAPFNLVLLLDVSGSVENYVDFIRKAARAFIATASPNDKIAIIIFNEDVKQLSTFTADKAKLSESLDTFDAGGGTSYYDAVAFVLAETLRPLRGAPSAVVVLTDGDDNHSFLPFDALVGSIQESGALIYPLYVPSGLIAASRSQDLNQPIDTVRSRYMGLTSKAEGEGERLAQVSGGVYYPISQLGEIQKAYDDIVLQLRTAYSVTFRSNLYDPGDKRTASPRLKVKIKRENAFVRLGSVVEVKQ
ncbi:MAG: VWA domain-containing protein [Acidobacteria bacterium]|nr:VWA domain-containing protein [Acidobacteriota bacterium]